MGLFKRKVVLVGTGFVGMSFAYSALNRGVFNELVLIDIDKDKTVAEAMDLNHGLAYAKSNAKIYSGEYSDCKDADIVVICAGVAQKPGETRLELLQRNTDIFKTIISPIKDSGFKGIYLVASNPVDIMTRVTQVLSGADESKVIGSGTTLDTARLKFDISERIKVSPKNIHAYVMGEHGDSEMVPWSNAYVGTKSILKICEQGLHNIKKEDLPIIAEDVKNAAYKIIKGKRATYYGIGIAIANIVEKILNNEESILTISACLNGVYGQSGVYAGVPCVISGDGLKKIIEVDMTDDEMQKFKSSCETLEKYFKTIKF